MVTKCSGGCYKIQSMYGHTFRTEHMNRKMFSEHRKLEIWSVAKIVCDVTSYFLHHNEQCDIIIYVVTCGVEPNL